MTTGCQINKLVKLKSVPYNHFQIKTFEHMPSSRITEGENEVTFKNHCKMAYFVWHERPESEPEFTGFVFVPNKMTNMSDVNRCFVVVL